MFPLRQRGVPVPRDNRRLMTHHDFNSGILDEIGHRPWQMPDGPWLMTQTWRHLLFAHWRVEPAQLRPRVPREFELEVFDGTAWIGVVPFEMSNVAPRGVPSLPWVSEFPELNVRTYVRVGDRPGIYFFSLDAGSTLAVRAARALLNLPYYAAAMTAVADGEAILYRSQRNGAAAEFVATYAPDGQGSAPSPGTLEYFLTERYCLYHLDHRANPYRLEIHHPPWDLQPARAAIDRNTMGAINGFALTDPPALLHYVQRQDMVAWAPSAL
jgi:uncharacterized protein